MAKTPQITALPGMTPLGVKPQDWTQFTIEIRETITYLVNVQARSLAEAKLTAEDAIVNDDDRDNRIQSITREIVEA